jgi:hypothetical protein
MKYIRFKVEIPFNYDINYFLSYTGIDPCKNIVCDNGGRPDGRLPMTKAHMAYGQVS